MLTLPTLQQQQLLIFGYFRVNYSIINFPIVLVQLALKYCNQLRQYMNFKNEKLQKLLSMKNHEAIYGKSFEIDDIIFNCSLCPNGWALSQTGKFLFYLELQSLPDNISSISVHYKLYLKELNIFWCNSVYFINNSKMCRGWNKDTLFLSECLNLNELTFCCDVKLLEIIYKSHSELKPCRYRSPYIFIKDYYKHNLNITNNTKLNKLLKVKLANKIHEIFCSYYIDTTWYIEMFTHSNGIRIILRICELPQKIKRLMIGVYGFIEFEGNKTTYMANYHTIYKQNHTWRKRILDLECNKVVISDTMDVISFQIEIDVIDAYDFNDEIVPKQMWDEYGIIQSNHSN